MNHSFRSITIFIFLFTSLIYSQADTLFGPKQYLRLSGSKTEYTDNFTVPNLSPDQYHFVLLNGNAESDSMISSAVVTLNGSVLVRQSDLNQNVSRIDREVYLQENNTLEITLASKPSSYITIFIYTETPPDLIAPELIVTAPAEGWITGAGVITVSGTVTDESPVELRINDIITGINPEGSFSSEVNLSEGVNTITVTAEDDAGNTTTVTRNVIRDSYPPVLTITEPSENLITNLSSINLAGTVTDSTETTVTVNGETVELTGGNLNRQINLTEGLNTITITAEDEAGNYSTITRTVRLDSQAPVIMVAEPNDSLLTNIASVLLSGTVTDSTAVTLTINGEPAEFLNGQFSKTLNLTEGLNTITITAFDEASNTSTETLYLTLDTSAPLITISSPGDSLITNQLQIILTGNVNEPDAVVTVNGSPVSLDASGNFSTSVSLTEGINTITITAEDGAGNINTITRTVFLDIALPVITVTNPADSLVTNSSSLQITGSVQDLNDITLTINSQPVQPDQTGNFLYNLSLAEGINSIVIEVSDAAGNNSTISLLVILDTQAPQIILDSDPDNLVTADSLLEVSGRVIDSTEVTFTLNGDPVMLLTDGSFSATVSLLPGLNQLQFTAADEAGNTSTSEASVILVLNPPSLTITEPEDGIFTNSLSRVVSGTASDTLSFSVYVNGTAVTTDSSGNFEHTVTLNEGANSIEIYAENYLGLRTTVYRTVNADTTDPVITYEFTYFPSVIQINGTVTDLNEVSLQINGGPVQLDANGSFSVMDSVSDGEIPYTFIAEDIAGNQTLIETSYYADAQAPQITLITPIEGKTTTLSKVYASGRVTDSSSVTLSVNGTPVTLDEKGFFRDSISVGTGTTLLTFTALDEKGNSSVVTRTVIRQIVTIPPDPSAIAPPLGNAVSTSMYDRNSFLFEGEDAIQFGVDPGIIVPKRVSLVRGTVVNKQNQPLPGVMVLISGHPEFGFTFTRENGNFDLCYNGGGIVQVSMTKEGYLPAVRNAELPWNDYALLDTVVMIQPDSKVTQIDFSQPAQTASGSIIADQDGERTAVISFADSTTAVMVLEDSTEVLLESVNLRITEYSVGENGPETMPVVLPPTSAYTYCFSITADEEIASNAVEVRLDKPAMFYSDNFLLFPNGTRIPVGVIDRENMIWIPKPDGIVLEVIDVVDNKAVLSADLSGAPADSARLDSLGIDGAELTRIAGLYSPGESFWRTEVKYFGIVDHNWAPSVIDNAETPQLPMPKTHISELINEPLTKDISITGTNLNLNYQSDRQIGIVPEVKIQLCSDSIPQGLNFLTLTIEIEGRKFYSEFAPTENLTENFIWDGMDAFGRVIPGVHYAKVKVGYRYNGRYQFPADLEASFASVSGEPIPTVYSRQNIVLQQEFTVEIPLRDNRVMGLGGWNLSPFHGFDLNENVIYFGSGRKRESIRLGKDVIVSAGKYNGAPYTDGMMPSQAKLGDLCAPVVGEDGTLYFAAYGYGVTTSIYKIPADGKLYRIAGGNGSRGTNNGDGLPAKGTRIGTPRGIALDKEGNIYFTESLYNLVRKIDKNGILSTVAGNGISGYSGDGGPALEASVSEPYAIVIMDDGTIYFSDQAHTSYNGLCSIRKIGTDGIITTVAGGNVSGTDYENLPANQIKIYQTYGITKDLEGNIYFTTQNAWFSSETGNRLFKLKPDGYMVHIAGNGSGSNLQGTIIDGRKATEITTGSPGYVIFDDKNNILLNTAYLNNFKVWSVSPEGIINSYIGTGIANGADFANLADSLPKPLNKLSVYCRGLACGPDGTIYIASGPYILHIAQAAPGYSGSEFSVPNDNGSQLFYFDQKGHHIRTENAYTGKRIYSFLYDENDLIIRIIDKDSLVTVIERDSLGNMLSITAPYGDKTDFTLNENGYISSITNPNGETVDIQYTNDGLLTSFEDAKDNQSAYGYNESGSLVSVLEPENGEVTTDYTGDLKNYSTGTTMPLGSEYVQNAEEKDNLTNEIITVVNGSEQYVVRLTPSQVDTVITPDGMITMIAKGYDKRFGAQVPVLDSAKIKTPSGLLNVTSKKKIITLMEGTTVKGFEERITQNGKLSLSGWDGNQRMTYNVSPEGRQQVTYLNEKDQVIEEAVQGLYPTNYTYDALGRLKTQSTGTRSSAYEYDPKGRLYSVTDPLNRTTRMYYDDAGRVTKNILADNREVNYTYDANGNLTSIIPPGRDAHIFEYNNNNVNDAYIPPVVNEDSLNATRYLFNADGALTATILPDGSAITTIYDTTGGVQSNGKVKAVAFDRGIIFYNYNYSTGQLTSVTAPGGNSITYQYDGSLNTAEIISGEVNGKISVAYNNDFAPASQAVNDSLTVTFAYDKDGLMTRAGDLHITYDPENGLPVSDSLLGVETEYSYNDYGEITGFNASYLGNSLYSYSFIRDELGRIRQKTEIQEGVTSTYNYDYDSTGRLTTVRKGGLITSEYRYDSNGNRTAHIQGSDTTSGVYDEQDRLISYGNTQYFYNKNGYLTTQISNLDTTKYVYDNFGNLISVTLPDGKFIEYLVDANNRRIGKKVNGVVEKKWLYTSGLLPIAEVDTANNIKILYIPGGFVKNGVTYRTVTDHLGSVKEIVDISIGEIVLSNTYDEYGSIVEQTGDSIWTGFDFAFAGGIYDSDTKLTRFGARDYDAETGRWTAKDPILFEGGDPNLYGYCVNDPVNSVDANGQLSGTLSNNTGLLVLGGLFTTAIISQAPALADAWGDIVANTLAAVGDLASALEISTNIDVNDSGDPWVVRGGIMDASNDYFRIDPDPLSPTGYGFSVKYKPGANLLELVAGVKNNQFRVTKMSFVQMLRGVFPEADVKYTPSANDPYHGTFVTMATYYPGQKSLITAIFSPPISKSKFLGIQ